MREIYFRAKRVDTKTWVYGDLLQQPDFYGKGKTAYFIYEAFDIASFDSLPPPRRVIGETVGQYTGLTDKNGKNGKKIFEGDIVRYVYEPGEGFWNANQLSVIKWDSTGFKLDGIEGTNKYALMVVGWLTSIPHSKDTFEVVGNIYDNPELLEGGDMIAK